MSTDPVAPTPTVTTPERRRLTRAEQLTLTTWRWAFVAVCHRVEPPDLLPQVALQAVLARLRTCTDPLQLFARHAVRGPELALVASLLSEERCRALDQDLVDSAFLLRWNELVADGHGPEELPPLVPRQSSAAAPEMPALAAERSGPGLPDRPRVAWTSDASAPRSRP
jgi:hypothetical protein